MTTTRAVWSTAALVALSSLILAAPVAAQRIEAAPDELAGVGIEPNLEAQLPLDLTFRDDNNQTVKLGDFFQGERPVLLSMTYSDCPMLCQLQLEGLVEALKDFDWSPGGNFELVNVSIDPNEKWQRARQTKVKFLEQYGRPETHEGWHFLVGPNVDKLADAVGFHYKYVEETKQYVHAAGIFLCTPDGRLSRCITGVQFPVQTLRLSLVEAGQGKIGTVYDQMLLFCFHYDAESGRYGPAARRIMQLGASLTLLALLVGLTPYWLRNRRAKAEQQGAALDDKDTPDSLTAAEDAKH